mgnify:CR=1 FL=1
MFSRSFCILVLIGGLIVATSFVVGLFLGVGTWESWWIANFLHFLGGGYAFFFVRALFNLAKTRHKILVPRWMGLAILVGGALVLGVFWEWFEFILDRYRVFILEEPSLMTYADNIGDLIIDFLGALMVGVYLYAKQK